MKCILMNKNTQVAGLELDEELLYNMIYKRKSFHLFRNIGKETISLEKLEEIEKTYQLCTPLCPEIKTAIQIVPSNKTNCKRGQEYCILFYSEKKDNYLQNIGYLGEQLELNLVSQNIGTLWFGIGKVKEESYEGLEFVIMMGISQIDDEKKFRKDMFQSKRKALEEIWVGEPIEGVAEIARFAPSACNTQPWFVENADGIIKVFRYKEPGKRGIMPVAKISYYNQIDIGIFLCVLELCLKHKQIAYEREMFIDCGGEEEKSLVAIYKY